MLTHWGLLENVRSMGHAMEASSADVFVSWLPLYHDMGLIGAWLGCCYFGARLYVMSPISFLVRPATWLWTMHKYRATFSGGPNFAFELCASRIDEADLQGLDLSALRFIVDGAEPISPQTLRRFNERFMRYGMDKGVVSPSYGLAENCVGLCFPPPGRGPLIDRIKRESLAKRGYAEPAGPDDADAIEMVACGHPIENNEVRIVDDAGRELGERQEGMLEFRGPSITKGYFRNEAKTQELFHDGWVKSGDRAYIAGGDIHITGRVKDIIIRAGRNTYPHEIEEAVSAIPGIRKGGVAAFGSPDPAERHRAPGRDGGDQGDRPGGARQADRGRARGGHRDRGLGRRRHRAGAAARRAEDLERQGAALLREGAVRDRPHRREAERRVAGRSRGSRCRAPDAARRTSRG